MSIVNRDLNASEQQHIINADFAAVPTGKTLTLFVAPYPCEVKAVRAASVGVSGSATSQLMICRFVAAGLTAYTTGWTSLSFTGVGTSGIQTIAQAAAGSTLVQLQAGDWLAASHAGTNAAVDGVTYSVIIQALQDIKTFFGS